MDTKILARLEEIFSEEIALVEQDLGSLEEMVIKKMRLLGQGLLQQLVNRKPNGYEGSSLVCKCGGSMKFIQHRNKDIHTLFGWHVWLEACKCGLREAEEIIYLGDGAPWIRTEHHRHFGRATFIIDWFHASEHLWDCGKIVFGEGTEATEKWVRQH